MAVPVAAAAQLYLTQLGKAARSSSGAEAAAAAAVGWLAVVQDWYHVFSF